MSSEENIAPTASGVVPSGPHPAVSVSTTSAPVVAHNFASGMTAGAPPSGVPPGVPAINNSGAAQLGVPPSAPGSMTVGPISSGVLPVPVKAPLGHTPSGIPGGTTSGAHTVGPLNLQTAYVSDDIPFDNEGQFRRPNGAVDYSDDSGVDSDDDPEDQVMKEVGDDDKLKLSEENQKILLKGIAECSDPDTLVAKLEALLPEGRGMSLQKLQEILKPSRWGPEHQEEALSARNNIQKAISAGKNPNWEHHHGGPSVSAPPVPKLHPFHREAYKEATQYLHIIAHVITKNPERTDMMTQAEAALGGINARIMQLNQQSGLDTHTGTIDLKSMGSLWHAINGANSPEAKQTSKRSLKSLCDLRGYPRAWRVFPPKYEQPVQPQSVQPQPVQPQSVQPQPVQPQPVQPQSVQPQSVQAQSVQAQSVQAQSVQPQSVQAQSVQPQSVQPQSVQAQSVQAQSVPPQSVQPQSVQAQSVPPQSVQPQSVQAQSVQPQSVLPQSVLLQSTANGQLHQTTGARKVIALAPRMIKRAIEPGKTSTGEKICFVQKLGENRARFVVESSDQTRRLVESSDAGGFVAIEGARRAGVPETTREEADIIALRSHVRNGGIYGLTFVAVGEWDPTQKRLPFIVVGFYYSANDHVQATEYAISKSNLGKILSAREAERLIVEGIVGHQRMTLREALNSHVTVDPYLHGVGQMQQSYLSHPQSLSHQQYGFNPHPNLQQNHFPQQLVPYVQQHATNLQPVQQQPYFPHHQLISQQALPQQAPVIPQQQQYYQQHPAQVSLGISPMVQPQFHSYNSDGEEL